MGLVLLLSACATVNNPQTLPTPDYSQLYLRGVFNWWEAEPRFKVDEVQAGVYRSRVELIGDGEPQDFRFADEHYTPGANCGSNAADGDDIRLQQQIGADCFEGQQNFRFSPTRTGWYEFYIDFSRGINPVIYILREGN